MVVFYSNLLQINLYTVMQMCHLTLFSSPRVLGLQYTFLPLLFTKKLFSNTGLVGVFLLESMTSLVARIPPLSKIILSVQMSMGTEKRKAGGMLTFEGTRGKR